MKRVCFIVAVALCASTSAEAGWLSDKLERAAERVGDKAISDVSDGAYTGTKKGVQEALKKKGAGSSSEASKPYAPMATLPSGVKPDPFTESMLANPSIPGMNQVSVPPYPGAHLIAAYPVKIGGSQQPEQMILKLVTDDPPERVVEYYRRELSQWSTAQLGILYTFWKGEGQFDPGNSSSLREMVPWMVITNNPNPEYWPQARSHIEISYRP